MITCQGFAPGRRPIEIGDGEPIPVELRRFQYAGTFTFWVVGTDESGNETTVTHTYTVRSAPKVDLYTPADGEVFVLGQEVQADYFCEGWLDGGPDIVTCDGTVAAGDLVDTSTLGDYSFTVTGVDADGNETTVTHAYSVVEDTTPPTATLFTPADGAIYALGEEVHVDWFCDDASGFVICDGTASYGDLVDTTTVGEHIFTMTATDGAGNETVVTHTYSVE